MSFLRSIVADARSRKSASGPAETVSTAAASNGRGSSRGLPGRGIAADWSRAVSAEGMFSGTAPEHREPSFAGGPSDRGTIAPGPLHDRASTVGSSGIAPDPQVDSIAAPMSQTPATVTAAPNETSDASSEPVTGILQVETSAPRDRDERVDEGAFSSSAESAVRPEADANLSRPAVSPAPEHDDYARASSLPERTVESDPLETSPESPAQDRLSTSETPAGRSSRASISPRSEREVFNVRRESPEEEHRSAVPRLKSPHHPESSSDTAGHAGEGHHLAPAPSVSNEMPSSDARSPETDLPTASGRAAPWRASGPPFSSAEAADGQARAATPQLGHAPAGPTAEPSRPLRERDHGTNAPAGPVSAEPRGPSSSQPVTQAAGRVKPPRQRPASDRSAPGSQPLPQQLPPTKAASDEAMARSEPTAIRARAVQNTAMPRQSDRSQTTHAVPKTPEVKIGQVDVFFEAPRRADRRGASPARPSVSLASRFYLRRL